jgi:serine/threonine protein phosphatase 1
MSGDPTCRADAPGAPGPGRVTFIGDVHGWADRLALLLGRCTGPLVFMGDLIDRGPDAPRVLDMVHARCEAGDRCLLGNHEHMLLRALGHPGIGLPGNDDDFRRWRSAFAGDAVMRAYGAADAAGLRRAMADHLDWLAELPWVLTGPDWIAVHAGLFPDEPWADQVARLERGWADEEGNLAHLYHKHLAQVVPMDLPAGWVVASGHTPQPQVVARPGRILCDTSGGMPGRLLSAVAWPGFRTTTSG